MIKLVLVDDHPLVLQGLVQVLSLEPDLEIVATCQDGAAAVPLIRDRRPDVAVVDGNPAVIGLAPAVSEVRKGAYSGCRRTSSQPIPSTRNTHTRSAGSSGSPRSNPGTPRPAATAGSRSASEPQPYAGAGASEGSRISKAS